ncbi:MAG: UMP kinase [Deltaproteobacteria bacterium]|jgi:uridylate kinase|nr:UMP kinase [Deltaproteobacteria bacterium]
MPNDDDGPPAAGAPVGPGPGDGPPAAGGEPRRPQRVLLKISGEALQGGRGFGLDPDTLDSIASQIAQVSQAGVQTGVVVGGGNIFRGQELARKGLSRVTGDHMGMLATAINALALQESLERCGLVTRVMSAVVMTDLAEPFIRRRAVRHLEKGRTVVFAAGTGNPFFTTDTAAVLRASETGAELILKATNVDGVYERDPRAHPDARLFETVSYADALRLRLRVMDMTALAMAMENRIPSVVFNIRTEGNILKAATGRPVGTRITCD